VNPKDKGTARHQPLGQALGDRRLQGGLEVDDDQVPAWDQIEWTFRVRAPDVLI